MPTYTFTEAEANTLFGDYDHWLNHMVLLGGRPSATQKRILAKLDHGNPGA